MNDELDQDLIGIILFVDKEQSIAELSIQVLQNEVRKVIESFDKKN